MANYNAAQMASLIKAFKASGTVAEIAQVTGFDACTVGRYARVWHKSNVIYISRWVRSKGHGLPVAVYRLQVGGFEDAPKPPPLTNAERELRYRMRKRGVPETVLRQDLIVRAF